MLKTLFKRTFDIRDGEIRISFFMQAYIFLLITVLLMVKPTINALFLSQLGAEHLPYGYILVALVAVISSYFYNKAVKKYSLRIIAIVTLVFFSLCFALLSVLMYAGTLSNWSLYAYYLSVALFAVLVTSQFWIIANMVYNAREAKRLFGFIGAGAIAGGIFGGYLTSLIASAFGNRVVILVAALLILCCIPILQTVWRMRIGKMGVMARNQRKVAEKESYASPFKLIRKSKHLTYLAAIVGVGVIMAKLVDFQFSDFANRAIPDSDQLASFFGFWFSSFNVLALLIQLFLTNRMLAWLGVTTNLLILPLGIAIGCLLFLTFPELWVLIIIKGMDGSFKQSINKAGIELSILPIPQYIKNEAKSFIDVVVDSIATGLAGLMLIFVIRKLELSSSYITVIILFILFVWVLLIYKLREAYFESFRTNIKSSLVSDRKKTKKLGSRTSAKRIIQVLTDGSEEEILLFLNRLQGIKLRTFEPHIIRLLEHPSAPVKVAAIEQLFYYRKGTALSKIRELIHSEEDSVVYAAMDYLLHHTHIQDDSIYKSYLDHKTDYISGAALLCLAKQASMNASFGLKFNLTGRITNKIRYYFAEDNEYRKEEIAELLMTVGYAKEAKFYSFISANFNNKDPYIVNHAIEAAGISSHEPFINSLISFLAEKEHRKAARIALRSYGVGITKRILQLDISENIKDDVKPYIPKVIQSFRTKESVRVLLRLLQSKDFVIRLEAAKSLNKLKTKGAHLKLDQRLLTKIILKESEYYRHGINSTAAIKHEIEKSHRMDVPDSELDVQTELLIARESLQDVLQHQLDQSLECIFKLLRLKYEEADIDVAYYGLKSEVRDTKINAVEFLDNLLQSRLKSKMLPLIEYHIIDSDEYGLSSFTVKELSENTALKKLLKNRGARMKLAVLNVLKYLDDPSYKKVITPLLKHENKRVRSFAKNALDHLRKTA